MNKSEIKEELMSKIKIELDTLFYMPGEDIIGNIRIYPGIKLKIKNNTLHLKLKIVQYEFWEYTNIVIDELKNIHKTEISIKNITYELKEKEEPNFKENENFGNFSIILIEKEDKDKFITIPFEYKLNKDDNNLLPTFQFETDKYILGIRHLLIVECEEYNSLNYIGLFIGKQQNTILSQPKEINNTYIILFNDVEIKVVFEKQSFYYGEKFKYDLKSNSQYNLTLGHISFRQRLYRKIEWLGYMRNSLLDKKIYIDVRKHIDDFDIGPLTEFFIKSMINGIFIGGGIGGISGGIIGGIICPNVFIGVLLGGTLSYIAGTFGGMLGTPILDDDLLEQKSFKSHSPKQINNLNNEQLKEELKKFVYFKGNKIVGFIKFKNDITPPVNGYYFKCDYNFKLDIEREGILLPNKNILKNKIDFYDGDEYIGKMKKLLNFNYTS